MKLLRLSAAILLAALPALAQDKQPKQDGYGLPDLNVIKTATLAPCYSCRAAEEFKKGYEGTALFLSAYSRRRNSPDLLFNGSRGSEDYFEAATAGDDMALVADLGVGVSLDELSAVHAFNVQRVHSFPAYSKFARVAKVEPNHTYAVLLSKDEIRALFLFTVVAYVPNQQVELRYAVKEYQVQQTVASSPGLDWGKTNR